MTDNVEPHTTPDTPYTPDTPDIPSTAGTTDPMAPPVAPIPDHAAAPDQRVYRVELMQRLDGRWDLLIDRAPVVTSEYPMQQDLAWEWARKLIGRPVDFVNGGHTDPSPYWVAYPHDTTSDPQLRYEVILNSAPVGAVLRASGGEFYGLALRVGDLDPCWAVTGYAHALTTARIREIDPCWYPLIRIGRH